MVPMLLSSNLCSLRGGEERLAFSVIWEIDQNADIVKTRFTKSGLDFFVLFFFEIFFLTENGAIQGFEISSSSFHRTTSNVPYNDQK